MQYSKKKNYFRGFFTAFLKPTSKFEHFEKMFREVLRCHAL